jgi:hypothetical protein
MSVDAPSDGETTELGQNLTFRGWAGNRSGPGTGVDRVMVLDAPMAAGGEIVTEARYGGSPRPDLADFYGDAWVNSDFEATWMAAGSTGNRTFWVYAHSIANDGWTNKTVTVRMTPDMGMSASPAAVVTPYSPPTNDRSPYNEYEGQRGMGVPYGNQYDQYGNQYGRYGNPIGSQYGQYGNQLGSSYGQYDPYGNLYSQTPYNSYNQYGQYGGYPYGSLNCSYNAYGSSNYGSYSGVFGGSSNLYACPAGYGAGLGTPGPTVVATAGADGTIVLSWAPVPGASQFRIYQLTPSANLVATQSQTIGGLSVVTTLSGLVPGSQHTYQVRSVSSGGGETIVFASWLDWFPANAAGVASVLVFTGASTSNTVSLNWSPSATSSVTNYQITQSLFSNGPFVPSVVSGVSSGGATVGGLLANTTYYFQVTAFAGSTSSSPSAVVSAITTS